MRKNKKKIRSFENFLIWTISEIFLDSWLRISFTNLIFFPPKTKKKFEIAKISRNGRIREKIIRGTCEIRWESESVQCPSTRFLNSSSHFDEGQKRVGDLPRYRFGSSWRHAARTCECRFFFCFYLDNFFFRFFMMVMLVSCHTLRNLFFYFLKDILFETASAIYFVLYPRLSIVCRVRDFS